MKLRFSPVIVMKWVWCLLESHDLCTKSLFSQTCSHNHELKANKQLIFTLARIPQGMQKYIDEKCCYCSSFFCFLTLHAATGGIHKFIGFLIMLVFQSRISN